MQSCINITIIDDDALEGDYSFTIFSSNASSWLMIVIEDNEGRSAVDTTFAHKLMTNDYNYASHTNEGHLINCMQHHNNYTCNSILRKCVYITINSSGLRQAMPVFQHFIVLC